MNIAMFTDSYKPQINGVVTSIDIFAKHLRKRGHKVYIFAPEDKNAEKEDFVFRFKSLPFQAYRGYRIGVPYKILLEPEIKKIKFDIVHIHSPFSLGAAGLGFAKYYKIPLIGTFHTLFPDYIHYAISSKRLQNMRLVRKLFQRTTWAYLTWFYNRCHAVIVPSENILKILERRGIKRKIFVIPTGIEMKKAKSTAKKALRSRYGFGDEKILLHVGRISKEKNIKFIINSLEDLLRNESVRLVIASDGPYKDELEKYVKKIGLAGRIKFTGYLSDSELNDFYKLSDIFVFASVTETQGIVLAEAAINKLPIVALDAPVTADFVKENNTGIVSDKENFQENVRKLLNNKLIKKYTENSEQVRKKYDIGKCVEKLLNIYSDLM